jgi:DUF3102 family protein
MRGGFPHQEPSDESPLGAGVQGPETGHRPSQNICAFAPLTGGVYAREMVEVEMANPILLPETLAFVETISTRWKAHNSVDFEVGDMLLRAKETLPHGQFLGMTRTALPFTARTAQRLMTIAKDQRLRNATRVSYLPTSQNARYAMTKLKDEELENLFATGKINPKLTRHELQEAVRPKAGPSFKPRRMVPKMTIDQAIDFLIAYCEDLDPGERMLVLDRILSPFGYRLECSAKGATFEFPAPDTVQ